MLNRLSLPGTLAGLVVLLENVLVLRGHVMTYLKYPGVCSVLTNVRQNKYVGIERKKETAYEPGFEPGVGLCADSSEPGACLGFCVSVSLSLSLSLSAPPPLALCLSHSLKNK